MLLSPLNDLLEYCQLFVHGFCSLVRIHVSSTDQKATQPSSYIQCKYTPNFQNTTESHLPCTGGKCIATGFLFVCLVYIYIHIQQSALWHLSKQVTKEETMPVPGNDWCNTKYETERVMPGMKYSENPMRTLTNARTSKYLQFTLERINLNYAGKGILILIWIHSTIFTTVVFCKMLCVGERPSKL